MAEPLSEHSPSTVAPPERKPGDVYCSNCGYVLTGLTDAARCPECGRPLVEVLTRVPFKRFGRAIRYRSEATLFGVPVIDVALGPMPERGEARGMAKGIIAVGDVAIGGIAIGSFSAGIVSVGGLGVGVCAVGGAAAGLLTAMGGFAIGGYTVGGASVGLIATGGGAVGVVAQGGGAAGVYVRGGGTVGVYRVTPVVSDPEAVRVFDALSPLLGSSTTPGFFTLGRAALSNTSITTLLALSVWLVAIARLRAQKRQGADAVATGGREGSR
jgi:hypothetical protein